MGVIENIDNEVAKAVAFYWNTRKAQREKQKKGEKTEIGRAHV